MNEESRKLLAKAEEVIEAVDLLIAGGKHTVAAGRAYYAMFHAARALLAHSGMHPRTHGGVSAAIGQHFAKTGLLDSKFHRWLIDAFLDRLESDYEFDIEVTVADAARLRARAREFIDAVRVHLTSRP